jgi:hypothetical protein
MHRAQMRIEAEQADVREAPPVESREVEVAPSFPVTPAPVPVVTPAPSPAPMVTLTDPRAELESSGLQMVETRAGRASAPEPAADVQPLGRPRRERPRTSTEDDSLVQIETKQ